jgi:hypothetical protein
LNISDKLQNDVIDFRASIKALMIRQDSDALEDIKLSLNSLFKGTGCQQVIYTQNFDKEFFGVCVMPSIPAKEVIRMLQSDEKYIIKEYFLELDSKLFDAGLGLTDNEIAAIILHEVGLLITDSTPIEKAKQNIDDYLLQQDETIKLTESIHYMEILSYGIRDTLRKVTSIFETDEDKIVDPFDVNCGNTEYIKTGMSKISSNSYNPFHDVDNKIVVLSWVLRLYKDVLHNRIAAIHSLKRGIELTASKLECKEMQNVIRRLERIDDDVLIEGAFEDILNGFKKTTSKMKANGIKQYEDDYYEIEFNVNNMETTDDAVLLLHQINSRMSVIDDYLTSEDLDKSAYKKWSELYSKYNALRGTIAKNKIYQNKTRLYVNYGYDD